MKVVALADTHGNFPVVPECDLLLLAGDVCRARRFDTPEEERKWLEEDLRNWLLHIRARKIVAVAGNHDFSFSHNKDLVANLPWTLLEDETIEWEGLRIFGSPWKLWLQDYSNTMLGMKNTEPAIEKRLQAADRPDVLLFHDPPLGILDQITNGEHIGSRPKRALVEKTKPALVVFGHVHEAHGRTEQNHTHYANAGIVKPNYELIPEIFTYELERNPRWHVVSVKTSKLDFTYKHDPKAGHIRASNR